MEHSRSASKQKRFRESRLSLVEGSHGHSSFRDDARTPLLILMAATGMVLLIAMANAANLLLARSAERRRELAIRAAMGAGRGELMGQLFTEALLLAAGGGLAGLALGVISIRLLITQIAKGETIHYLSAGLDWKVLLFALGLSVATGLLFGLYPAWDGARASLATTLKDESGQSSSTRGNARVRKLLVCAQVTISAVLLIPTGLFLKSLVNLLQSGSRHEDGEPDRVLGVAGPERLQKRAKPRAVRAHGGRIGGDSRSARRSYRASAADRREQLGQRCHDRRRIALSQNGHERTVQRDRARLFRQTGSAVDCGTRIHGSRYAGGARSGHRQRTVREGIPGGAQSDRPAFFERRRRQVQPGDRRGGERQSLCGREASSPETLLHALEAG